MSLYFGGATSNKVDCGSGTSIDSLSPMSCLAWVYPQTLSVLQIIASKNNDPTATGWRLQSSTADSIQVIIGAATSWWSYQSVDNTLTANSWQFYAFTFNSANSANEHIQIYKGSLTSAAAELSYNVTQDGSGGIDGDAALNLEIGNVTNIGNLGWRGRIAWVGIWNRELSLAEVRAQQWRPHKTSGCVFFMHLGYNGTSTQPDWSGNFNAGTVTGATVAQHVPLQIFQSPNIYSPYVVAAGGFQAAWAMNSNVVLGAGVPV